MRAITVRDREADGYGLSLAELPYPPAAFVEHTRGRIIITVK